MAPDLEQMLPSEVLGSTIRKASLTGEAALSELELDVDLRGAMAAAGGDVSGLQVAIGSPEDSSFVVVAMRVPGVDGAALQTALADSSELPVDQGEIAGKQVTRLGDDQWYYATDEVLFFVVGGVNEANEVIAQLP